MKLNPILFLLLRIFAVLWIIAGGIYLVAGIIALLQGRFGFSPFVLALLIGVGLLRQSYKAWQTALIGTCVFPAFHLFLFFMSVTSNSFSSSAMTMSWGETELGKIPNLIFYPLGFLLLVPQIWLLLSKPIRHLFLEK
jgi:hypothetical protein